LVYQILAQISDDRGDIVFPLRTHIGEKLAGDLNYMREHGCLKRIDLVSAGKRDCVMQQIHEAVVAMVEEHGLCFPPFISDMLELGPDEPYHDIRLRFANLPFRVLKPGNHTPKGHYLSYPSDAAYHDMEHSKITKLATKVKHPIDPDVGILFICTEYCSIFLLVPDALHRSQRWCSCWAIGTQLHQTSSLLCKSHPGSLSP
jgi:hypothetical protein